MPSYLKNKIHLYNWRERNPDKMKIIYKRDNDRKRIKRIYQLEASIFRMILFIY
jgi:hypothetical protein